MAGHRKVFVLSVFLVFALAAWPSFAAEGTSGGVHGSAPPPPPDGRSCVWLRKLQSGHTEVIDERHLMIKATDAVYLLTLYQRCYDLDTGLVTGFSTHGSDLCAPGDAIVTRSQICQIEYLEAFANRAEAKAAVNARNAAEKAAKAAEKAAKDAQKSGGQ